MFVAGLLIRITLMRIRILILIEVLEICDHWSADSPGLHFEPPGFNCEYTRPSTVFFDPLQLLNLDFNTDLNPAFHSNEDLDPASKNNADPDPQP
jgi:hypothetical protein